MEIDFETYSELDLTEVGAWAYAAHPSTEILCMAYQGDTMREPEIWLPSDVNLPIAIQQAIRIGEPFKAYNALFEQNIWLHVGQKKLGWPALPIDRWRCIAAKAAAYALPRSLEQCSLALKLPVTKDMEGKRTMLQLSQPRKPTKANSDTRWYPQTAPEKFEILHKYCKNDVTVENLVDKTLRDLPPSEQEIWELDQKINMRGVKFDRRAIVGALKIEEGYRQSLTDELRVITGGKVNSGNQAAMLVQWLTASGVDIDNARKDTILEQTTRQDLPSDVMRVLRIRQELAKNSTAKYGRMLASMGADDRIRDLLLYWGATTGRWAGARLQPHNFPRGKFKTPDQMETCVQAIYTGDYEMMRLLYGDNVLDTLSSALRGMILGDDLYVADYAQIEARIVMWLAGATAGLAIFERGGDPYEMMASHIYTKPETEIVGGERTLGKETVLGCGFGMGLPRFIASCESKGIKLEEEMYARAHSFYRQLCPEVPKAWYAVEDCAKRAIISGNLIQWRNIAFQKKGDFLLVRLPSGRLLSYPYPRIHENRIKFWGVKSIARNGVVASTKKWEEMETYGGKLVENIVQGIARDVMAAGMLRQEAAGYEVQLSIHDETLCEKKHGSLEEYLELTVPKLSWLTDCPVKAEGWVGRRYMKK